MLDRLDGILRKSWLLEPDGTYPLRSVLKAMFGASALTLFVSAHEPSPIAAATVFLLN